MSKAFTKEDTENELELEDAAEPVSPLPTGSKNYITPGGLQKLRTALRQLLDVERPEVVRVVSWAASNGDRSENGDYIYGKRRLREIDKRIRFLTKRIEAAEVIDPAEQKSDRVLFGATVTLRDEDEKERVYQIVGIDETDGKRGRISWISPMAKALLRARAGDTVTVRTPKGEEDLEILRVQYLKIED